MTCLLDQLEELRTDVAPHDGLPLLRRLLREGPLGGNRTALLSSFGAESVVLLDMIASVDPATPVIFLETGQLFPETEAYRKEVTELLGLRDLRVIQPDPAKLADHDERGDLWRGQPDLCCQIRKTEPLERALAGFVGLITGRKRFHGGARGQLRTIEGDPKTGRIKLNPLATWSEEDVARYRVLRGLPRHPMVARGYRSIGCLPCTRLTKPGEGVRGGRWAGIEKSECGIHGDGI